MWENKEPAQNHEVQVIAALFIDSGLAVVGVGRGHLLGTPGKPSSWLWHCRHPGLMVLLGPREAAWRGERGHSALWEL